MNEKVDIYKRALEREKQARKRAEEIIEEKSLDLYESNLELKRINASIEEEVRARATQLQELFDHMHDGYVILDGQGNLQKSNLAARRILGYSESEEIENLNLADIVHEEDREKSLDYINKLIKTGSYSNYVGRVYDKDGSVKYLEVSSNAIKDDEGNLIGSRDIIRDVTEKVETANQLRIVEERMSAVFENPSVGIAIFNPKSEFIATNQLYQRQLGFAEEYFHGKIASRVIHTDDIAEHKELIFSILRNEVQKLSIESRYVRKDKSIFWANTNVSGIYNEDGSLRYFISVVEDITEKKETQKKLEGSLRSLERANRDLQDFAHVVSHDLKAPLRSISGLVQIIDEEYKDSLDEQGQELMEAVITRTELMDELIGGILSYSSVRESENDDEEFESKLILEKLKLSIEFPPHITFKTRGEFPKMKMNSIHFRQLLQNMLTNAIKYNDKKKGEVSLSYEDDGENHVFVVSDNGRGIEERIQSKIFEMFQKFDTSGKTSSGIGLAIVKKILELYNGRVTLQSIVGEGSKFTFYLPKRL